MTVKILYDLTKRMRRNLTITRYEQNNIFLQIIQREIFPTLFKINY